MKALVTGASGFIGGHLVEALVRRGQQVRCLVRSTSRVELLEKLDVELLEGDVTDPESLRDAPRGVDVVYHAAGLTTAFRKSDLMSVNEQGTLNVAEACARRTSPPVLIAFSSLAAAGPAPRGGLLVESDPPAPRSNYGHSKRAGELAAEKWAGEVPTTIIRPSVVFGPRDRMTLSMFKPIASTGIHLTPGFGATKLSMIYVSDLIELAIRAVERGQRLLPSDNAHDDAGRGYYFASCGECPTYRELGKLMANAMGKGSLWVPVPYPFPTLVAAVNELISRLRGRPGGLTMDKLRDASAWSWACSTQKAEDDFGFAPAKPLIERLHETTQWYLDAGWLSVCGFPFWPRRRPSENESGNVEERV